MKKFVALMLAVACMVYAATPDLVYDFSASIKRPDFTKLGITTRKETNSCSVEKGNYATEKGDIANDTLKGYLLIPTCTSCSGDLYSTFGDDNIGIAYITSKKASKFANEERIVYKVPVSVKSAIFGAPMICADGQPLKAPTKAYMAIKFDLTQPGDLPADLNPGKLNKRFADLGNFLYNGLFGALHDGDVDPVRATGFGTVKVYSTKIAALLGLCGVSTPETSKGCAIIAQISGSIIGYPNFTGACGNTPMWDGCLKTDSNEMYTNVNIGVISGTWHIKYNNSLTEESDQEAAILKKLGVKPENVYVVEQP